MTPKHLPQSDFNDRQKLPPAATPKVGGEKNSMVQKPIKSIGDDPKTPHKAISTIEKNTPCSHLQVWG